MRFPKEKIRDVALIATNLHRRYSGINSTLERVVSKQDQIFGALVFGYAPSIPHLKTLPWYHFWKLWLKPSVKPFRIWHARRNNDMIVGIIFRDILRMPLRLVFTSAGARHYSKFTQYLMAEMDALIATSPPAALCLKRLAVAIPHGMDLQIFCPAIDKSDLRKSLGIPKGIVVGCFGRIRPSKGTDLFLEAMFSIMEEREDVSLLLAGLVKKEHTDFFQQLVSQVSTKNLLNRFIQLGEVSMEKIPDLYRCLDVYVTASHVESFGVTPLEAMASGIPVVATRVGTFETQIVEGETGFLVPPGDVHGLRDRIEYLIENPERREKMGRAARNHVVEHFGIDREVQAIDSVYETLWKSASVTLKNMHPKTGRLFGRGWIGSKR